MASGKSPLHPFALRFADFTGEPREVVVFIESEYGDSYKIDSYGRLKLLDERNLDYIEVYDGWESGKLIDELQTEFIGLLPADLEGHQLAELPSEELREFGLVRDPSSKHLAWSACFVVPREVAHQVLRCTVDELNRLLAERAAEIAAELQREADAEAAWYIEHEAEINAAYDRQWDEDQ